MQQVADLTSNECGRCARNQNPAPHTNGKLHTKLV